MRGELLYCIQINLDKFKQKFIAEKINIFRKYLVKQKTFYLYISTSFLSFLVKAVILKNKFKNSNQIKAKLVKKI